jgi:hypothetical protein
MVPLVSFERRAVGCVRLSGRNSRVAISLQYFWSETGEDYYRATHSAPWRELLVRGVHNGVDT